MKYVWGVLALIILVISVITLNPEWITLPGGENLALAMPFAQLWAMRGVLAIGFGVLGFIVLVIAIVRAGLLRRGIITGVLAVGLLAVGAGHYFTLNSRGLSDADSLTVDRGITRVNEGDGSIGILSMNTQGGETAMSDLIPYVKDNGIDVIVLVETSHADATELAAALEAEQMGFTVFSSDTPAERPDIESTAVLVSRQMGEYTQREALDLRWGSVRVQSATGQFPTIMAVHPVAPYEDMKVAWQEEITVAYAQCDALENYILAGDFNSTLDHMQAVGGNCTSALGDTGGVGTWPTRTAPILGSPIDGIFVDDVEWRSTSSAVFQVGDSDHRGVMARIEPVQGS